VTPDFYTPSPDWDAQVSRIVEAVGRVSASEIQVPDPVKLRQASRISAVHASTVIEGNRLSLPQATAVVDDELVFGPARDIQEVPSAVPKTSEGRSHPIIRRIWVRFCQDLA